MPLSLPLRMSNNKIQLFNCPVELYSCMDVTGCIDEKPAGPYK